MSILSKLKNMVNIGKITSAGSSPQVKTFASEIIDKVPYFQQSGFASIPINSTTVLMLSTNGDKSNPVAIADNTACPITLAAGECCIYKDDSNYIHCKNDGNIEVKTGTFKLLAGDLELDAGDVTASAGDVADSIGTLDELRQEYLTHVHAITQPNGTPSAGPTQP